MAFIVQPKGSKTHKMLGRQMREATEDTLVMPDTWQFRCLLGAKTIQHTKCNRQRISN